MYYESASKIMSCSEKLGFIGQSDAFLAGLIFGFRFCWIRNSPDCNSVIKRNMEGGLKSFQLYGSCSWRDLLKSGFCRGVARIFQGGVQFVEILLTTPTF